MDLTPRSRQSALLLRSLALILILGQFRLLAKDLADTPVFITTLGIAFIASWILARKTLRPWQGVFIIALIPWTTRFIIALPRIFFPDTAVTLDSLLLNLARNNFVSLIPFYWAGVSTYFSTRSRSFLRADIILSDTLLLIIFSIAHTADIGLYRWPIFMIALFTGILLLQILALILSSPPEFKLRKGEAVGAGLALCILALISGILFLRPSQERAVDQGGGLLEPNLFSFDFSQFLHLESEITMNDDLVFIVKKDPEDTHILLRRYVLSGYTSKQGFFRYEAIDEKTHPQKLPEGTTPLSNQGLNKAYRLTNQEYYLVNFDASAFIGMNDPVLITPFESWDASSFNAAYGVQSHTSEALPFELIDSVQEPLSPEALGLSPEAYALYTEYGGDEQIRALAQEICWGLENYWDQVQAIYEHLKYGEYRYSLKPGIAPDGDQLGFFLFQSKKGYCSYYAFSMALLLRSLGIPARVAAGFFIQPETNTFDYYPVRSDMAHAWVEVLFPDYGWIEYDPTTDLLAEGEEFRFSLGVSPELFERLMKEILDNHSQLRPKQGASAEEPGRVDFTALGTHTLRFLRTYWALALSVLLCISFIRIRTQHLLACKLNQDSRKKANQLWIHVRRRLNLGGYRKRIDEAEPEWALAVDSRIQGVYALYQQTAAARYGPIYTQEHFAAMAQGYTQFSACYAQVLPWWRRTLAWLLPPLALMLKPAQIGKDAPGRVSLGLVILLLVLSGDRGTAQDAVSEEKVSPGTLYSQALEAQRGENWERAIELYTKGSELYPEESSFPWSLGNLYYKRRLYGLAWDQYRKVEQILPEDTEVLYQLSRTAGYLNNDRVSVVYLERILALDPDNKEAIGNLGWMYYKLHRLEEGRLLLLSALDRFGPNPDFSMTLGTIYSDMFRYEDAKHWYLEAIAGSEALGADLFTAVANYNLSILETRFYHFDRALERTNASLFAQNRASGRLARGELFMRRLEFKQAFSDYQGAYEMDTSPLSKVNLAQSYQIAGRLQEARLYAEDCLKEGDLSWMLNYGIDPIRYKRDLHEILSNVYAGLEKTEYLVPSRTWREWIQGIFRGISYRSKASIHRRLFWKYSFLTAKAYETAGTEAKDSSEPQGLRSDSQRLRSETKELRLDALIQYYNAFEPYPRRALTYLRKSRDFEVSLIPEAAASYYFEEGRLLQDGELLWETAARFDPVWERDMIAKTYTELAQMKGRKGRKFLAHDAAERLYRLNRGGLRQYGIRLPVELSIDFSPVPSLGDAGIRNIKKSLGRALRAAGFDLRKRAGTLPQDQGSRRFQRRIRIDGPHAECELYDTTWGSAVFRHTLPLPSFSAMDINTFARTLGDIAFTEL
ncbi:MAG: tetratricopeptide repeat protein [Treponema sp.]|jgi:tetratricopeptide (TPR) repeat protein|nr:tetratricopeptide repeat protein [Treponema sp.]